VHAERAGSIDAIRQGKSELVQALPAAPQGIAILNQDDPNVLAMREQTAARVFTYGLDPAADLWADEVESMGLDGIRCRMHYGEEVNYLTAPLIGRHSVYTMLRAASVGLVLGMSWDWIFHALKNTPERLRIVTTRTATGALLIDDTYNANPQSVVAALNLLQDLSGRKVAVLGDMLELGRYEEDGHQLVGARAAEVADELVLIGERSAITRSAALRSGFSPQRAHWFARKEDAQAYLLETLKAGDVVLIKGSNGLHLDTVVAALEVTQ
jgi:UDP-N-acetylmuramoyl-tripeptide--D-alanyl-D-alanine ligase